MTVPDTFLNFLRVTKKEKDRRKKSKSKEKNKSDSAEDDEQSDSAKRWKPRYKAYAEPASANNLFALKHYYYPIASRNGPPRPAEQKAFYDKFARKMAKRGANGLLEDYNNNIKDYQSPLARNSPIWLSNESRNRYTDIVCLDDTRVVLKDEYIKDRGDYIHANIVPGLYSRFILTQGPIEATVIDFWRMVWCKKISHIAMLCNINEEGRQKCAPYFPTEKANELVFGDFKIVARQIHNVGPVLPDGSSHVVFTNLRVHKGDKCHRVYHLHIVTWDDKSVAYSASSILHVLHWIREPETSILIHCSAGIGRSGTLLAIEVGIQSILNLKNTSFIDIIKKLRDYRYGVVQTATQYLMVVQTVCEFGKVFDYIDNPETIELLSKLFADINAICRKSAKTQVADDAPVEIYPPESSIDGNEEGAEVPNVPPNPDGGGAIACSYPQDSPKNGDEAMPKPAGGVQANPIPIPFVAIVGNGGAGAAVTAPDKQSKPPKKVTRPKTPIGKKQQAIPLLVVRKPIIHSQLVPPCPPAMRAQSSKGPSRMEPLNMKQKRNDTGSKESKMSDGSAFVMLKYLGNNHQCKPTKGRTVPVENPTGSKPVPKKK